MRFSIRFKLFLALLLANLLVVALMVGFMQRSLDKGFVGFVEGRQQARAERLVEFLADLYVTEQGWQGLRDDRRRWRRLLHMADEGHEGRGSGPFDGGWVLLDAGRQLLAGPPIPPERLSLTPIRVEDAVIGYLGRATGRPLREWVDLRFMEQQRRAFVVIALAASLLAAGLSWPLAHVLVKPVQRLAEGARALAAGRLATRVAEGGRDELGDLARDFNHLAHTLERNEAARRHWMADIAHELRTPLAVLRAELEALQDGVRPLGPEAVASLAADVERLGRLVEDLHQLSMSDLGALDYRKREVNALALLRDDVEALAGEFERRGLAIEMSDPGTPVPLQADPDRLSQLFRNLLQNSLRYTDAGGRLVISVERRAEAVVFRFDDSAPGVPVDALDRLFERFYRVEGSRNRAHGGAGLGLAICRNIVEAHGGQIKAAASPQGGLRIDVTLPVTA